MNKPFLRLTFKDTSTTEDIADTYIVADSVAFDCRMLNGLNSSSNKAVLMLTKDCPSIEHIIGTKGDVLATLSQRDGTNETVLFTGYVTHKFKWQVTTHGETGLELTIEDMGTRLLKKTWNPNRYRYVSGKASDVVTMLCNDAGITRGDAVVIDTMVACGVPKDSKYETILKSLVRECGYAYHFSNRGQLLLERIAYSDLDDYTVDKASLYSDGENSIEVQKDVKQYGRVSVEWEEYKTLPQTTVYEDVSGRDDSHTHCNIVIAGNSTYPDPQGKPSFVEVQDIQSGRKAIAVSNVKPIVKATGYGLETTMNLHDDKSIEVLLRNTVPSEALVRELRCVGDLVVVNTENTTNAGTDGETYKEKTTWIHDGTTVDAYAQFLANYYNYCNQTYSFYTKSDMKLGDICRLKDETFSGLDTRVLLTGRRWILGGMYRYTGVGISKFDIKDSDTDSLIPPSTVGPSGPSGIRVDRVEYHYAVSRSATVPPVTWFDEVPEFTLDDRYLWSYSETFYTDGTSFKTKAGVIGALGSDGVAPVVATPTFNTYIFPATGSIIEPSEYEKMQCRIEVEQYPLEFTCVPKVTDRRQFSLTATGHGITNIAVVGDTIKATRDSVMATSSGYIDVKVDYRDTNDRDGVLKLRLTLARANSGKDGRYTAYEYALATSSTEAPQAGWTSTYPKRAETEYIWYRIQTVEPGCEIDPLAWSEPMLMTGDFTKVYEQIDIMGKRIAFGVTDDGKVYPNNPMGANFEIGTTTDGGYILLDASKVIASGTITADKVDTEDLYSSIIEVGDRIVSGGYRDVDASGNVNPYNRPGFYADASGVVKMIDAEVKGTIDSDILTTYNGIPRISSSEMKPEYRAKWDSCEAERDLKDWFLADTDIPAIAPYANLESCNGKLYTYTGYERNPDYGMYESSDGFHWIRTGTERVRSLAYHDGMYYGLNLHGEALKSTDGRTWVKMNNPLDKYNTAYCLTIGDNGTIVITGGDHATTNCNFYSTDLGATWHTITELSGSNSCNHITTAYGNGKFVAVAVQESDGMKYSVFDSPDGITWTRLTRKTSKEFAQGVSFDGGVFHVQDKDRICWSADGTTWNMKTGFTRLNGWGYMPDWGTWFLQDNDTVLWGNSLDATFEGRRFPWLATHDISSYQYLPHKAVCLLSSREDNSKKLSYVMDWSRNSIVDFYSSTIPKMTAESRKPQYEPLWAEQTCTGQFLMPNGQWGNMTRFKTSPVELVIARDNGEVYKYDATHPVTHPLTIRNLVLTEVAAIAYMGNTLPKNANVDLGTGGNKFRTINAVTINGDVHGNVNTEGERFTYKVWGAVAN